MDPTCPAGPLRHCLRNQSSGSVYPPTHPSMYPEIPLCVQNWPLTIRWPSILPLAVNLGQFGIGGLDPGLKCLDPLQVHHLRQRGGEKILTDSRKTRHT